jgi:DNA modification methylase
MIASEKNGRHARLMELDPKYCDVIVRRWRDFTGKPAHLENGRTFAELEVGRAKKAA